LTQTEWGSLAVLSDEVLTLILDKLSTRAPEIWDSVDGVLFTESVLAK